MKKNILEKLGINTETKVVQEKRWSGCGGCVYFTPRAGMETSCDLDENDERYYDCMEYQIIYVQCSLSDKEKIFNEMLEALINISLALELIQNKDSNGKLHLANIKVIEKATGKTWQEIKGILNV